MAIIALQQVPQNVKDWPVLVIDMGFSKTNRSSGMATANCGGAPPGNHRFSDMTAEVRKYLENLTAGGQTSAILILEAPLSVAFTHEGNPCHRQIELPGNYQAGQRPRGPKGWYYQAGANLILGSIEFLRAIKVPETFQLHLAEAFFCSIQAGEEHPDHHAVASQLLKAFLSMCGEPLIKAAAEVPGGRVASLPSLERRISGIPGILLRPGLALLPAIP